MSLLDLFGALDGIAWLKSRVSSFTLMAATAALGYLLLERHTLIQELERSLDRSTSKILSAMGGELQLHHSREEFFNYMTGHVRTAKQIDIVNVASGESLYSDLKEHAEWRKAVADAAEGGARVRRVHVLSNPQLLKQAVAEIASHKGLHFHVNVIPVQAHEELPHLSIMLVDGKVAIGGWSELNRKGSDDVPVVTSNHAPLKALLADYFARLREKSRVLAIDGVVDQGVADKLGASLHDRIEYIGSEEENYRRSAEFVATARRRVWVTSTTESGEPLTGTVHAPYDAAVRRLLAERPEVEFRRILGVTNEPALDKQIALAKGDLNLPNYLLSYITDRRPAIDVLIRDDDLILLGLRERQSSQRHDAVLVVRDESFVRVVAEWYKIYMWPFATLVKGNLGIESDGVEKIRSALRSPR